MATWQVDFHLVPRRALVVAARPLTPAVLDDTDWWASAALPADYARRLGAVAPAAPSVRAELETWGLDEGNRVDVRSRTGRVSSVTVRVDVRRLDSKFGAALLVFVRAADALLVRRDGLIVEPTINAYAAALRSSAAWRYANEPAVFPVGRADDDEQDE
ncbi:MAG TPA: hypothetical protein VGG84_16055 [Gemmatimonadaceae bacterium]|jgi:hypothetical protein